MSRGRFSPSLEPSSREHAASSLLARSSLVLCGSLLLAWLVGASLFLQADGSLTWTMPRTREPPLGEHNLAHYAFGPTLRASSFVRDAMRHYHPAFLVDGRRGPSVVEKWASLPSDLSPWLELRWREPRSLARVVITHGASHGGARKKRYRLRCLRDEQPAPSLEAREFPSQVASHTLSCERARGLRIDWLREPDDDDLVRVYEVEAWGR